MVYVKHNVCTYHPILKSIALWVASWSSKEFEYGTIQFTTSDMPMEPFCFPCNLFSNIWVIQETYVFCYSILVLLYLKQNITSPGI